MDNAHFAYETRAIDVDTLLMRHIDRYKYMYIKVHLKAEQFSFCYLFVLSTRQS